MSIQFNKLKTELDLNDGMPYGKYQGIPLARIIHDDPSYLNWMLVNSSGFYVSELVLDALEKNPVSRVIKPKLPLQYYPDFDLEEDIPF